MSHIQGSDPREVTLQTQVSWVTSPAPGFFPMNSVGPGSSEILQFHERGHSNLLLYLIKGNKSLKKLKVSQLIRGRVGTRTQAVPDDAVFLTQPGAGRSKWGKTEINLHQSPGAPSLLGWFHP